MATKDHETTATQLDSPDADVDAYLRQREAMEAAFADKFQHTLTVMFTDLKGSTAIAEKHGDLVHRSVISRHNEVLFPAVKENSGTLVKSIGDGTLSHFQNALDAVRAAVRIQKGIDDLNRSGKFPMPVLLRVGMHTGKCILEKNDIFGDTVNTASRFESAAGASEIYLSEDTYNALSDKSEIYIRYEREVTLKGKAEPAKAYKAFWNPEEIELDKQGKLNVPPPVQDTGGSKRHWLTYAVIFSIVIMLVGALAMRDRIKNLGGEEKRSIHRSVDTTPSRPAESR